MKMKMKTYNILCLFILVLQFQNVFSQLIATNAEEVSIQAKAQVPEGYRFVKNVKFTSKKKYDVVEYKWNITGYQKTGVFGYYVYSELGVCALLMNSTEYDTWTNVEYSRWLKSTDYQFNFLSDNLESYMCQSPVATCKKAPVRFPERELYMVIMPRPEDVETSYVLYDQVNLNYANAAELVYDPIKGDLKKVNSTIVASTSTKTTSHAFLVTTTTSIPTETELKSISVDEEDDNTVLYIIIGGIILFIVLIVIALLILFSRRRKNNSKMLLNESSTDCLNCEAVENKKAVAIGYVPHHTMKRVAYRYTCSVITLEKNDFIELIERYSDGWVKVIYPMDAKEYIIPLIILEGDYEDDLTNIPLVDNNDIRLLSTPENLYENKFISQEDYDEMKRNDDWIKKVKLMKRSKPESLADGSITNIRFSDETSSIKNNPHHFQRPPIESNLSLDAMDHSIVESMDSEKKEKRKAIKSMVATLELEDSNTELLLASDHVMEIYNNDDDDDENDNENTNNSRNSNDK